MKEITSATRRKFSFPSPVDVQSERRYKQNKNKNDERQPAFQNPKLYTRLADSRKLSEWLGVERNGGNCLIRRSG